MKHTLTISMEYEDSDPITSHKIIVSHDGQPIGCLSRLEFRASSEELFPEIKFAFPDLHDPGIDSAYHRGGSQLVADIDYSINTLSKIPNAVITLQPLDKEANVNPISEIGTEGYIDSVPMKKRHNP